MTPYGHCMEGYAYIFGEGKFEPGSASGDLYAIYLEPTHEGQEPFACIDPSAGLNLYPLEHMKTYKLTPVYKETK